MSTLPTAVADPGYNPDFGGKPSPASVLVIDDEELVRNALTALLQAEGFDAAAAASGPEGVDLLAAHKFEVAITDLVMPGMDGFETIAALKAVDPDVEVMILTGHVRLDSTIEALRYGACDFLTKPDRMNQLHTQQRKSRSLFPEGGKSLRYQLVRLSRKHP